MSPVTQRRRGLSWNESPAQEPLFVVHPLISGCDAGRYRLCVCAYGEEREQQDWKQPAGNPANERWGANEFRH